MTVASTRQRISAPSHKWSPWGGLSKAVWRTADLCLSALLSLAQCLAPLVAKWSKMAAVAPDTTSEFQVAASRKRERHRVFSETLSNDFCLGIIGHPYMLGSWESGFLSEAVGWLSAGYTSSLPWFYGYQCLLLWTGRSGCPASASSFNAGGSQTYFSSLYSAFPETISSTLASGCLLSHVAPGASDDSPQSRDLCLPRTAGPLGTCSSWPVLPCVFTNSFKSGFLHVTYPGGHCIFGKQGPLIG